MNPQIQETVEKLVESYPGSFVNKHEEFIAHERSNQYFILSDCETPFDIKCKALEWLSRPACKTEPYSQEYRNKKFHEFMLDGLNLFLDTHFDSDDVELIYTNLGCRCNHQKTIEFINNNYNMDVLRKS